MKKTLFLFFILQMCYLPEALSQCTGLSFNGTSSYATIPDNSKLKPTDSLTIEAWINIPSGDTDFANIVMKGNYGYGLALSGADGCSDGTRLAYWTDALCGNTIVSSADVPTDQWTHVAVVVTVNPEKRLDFYIDGQPAGSSTSSSITINHGGSDPLYIGRQGSGCACNYFNGYMDELRIWSTARTQSEITGLMNGCPDTFTKGLSAWYKFQEAKGINFLTDFSGNNLNGTLANINTVSGWVDGIPTNCCCSVADIPNAPVNDLLCPGSSGTIDIYSSQPGKRYYLFNNDTEEQVGNPVIGNGGIVSIPAGTISETTTYKVIGRETSRGLDFDGINDHVTIPHNEALVPSDSLTIEAWVYVRGTSNTGSNILMKGNYGYGLFLGNDGCSSGTRLNYWTSSLCGTSITSTGSISYNAWHHVAVVVTVNPVKTLAFYIDGKPAGASTSSSIVINGGGTDALFLGRQGSACACNYFDGILDEVRIWNKARTESEINSSMNGCFKGDENGLVAYYDFEDGAGTTLSDRTAGNFNGTLVNMDAGSDWVRGSEACGCEVEMTQKSTIHADICTGSLKASAEALKMNLYPNPAADHINVSFYSPKNQEARIEIADYTGKTLMRETVKAGNGKNTVMISTNDLPAGIYHVKLSLDNGAAMSRNLLIH